MRASTGALDESHATEPQSLGINTLMGLDRPFRRTCRILADGSYSNSGHWRYLLHPKFAQEPRHFVRAFLSLQADMLTLMDYVEPAEANLPTYSHKIQQLLLRACVEVEANFTAILRENGYAHKRLTMDDYRLVNQSHALSSFEVRVPTWRGAGSVRRPFGAWAGPTEGLPWYQAYNKSKHDRHANFHRATFEALTDAMAGLVVVLSAQFHDEEYSTTSKALSISSHYSYDTDDGMDSAIGGVFRVRFPTDWPDADRYDFNWSELAKLEDPFAEFDHAARRDAARM